MDLYTGMRGVRKPPKADLHWFSLRLVNRAHLKGGPAEFIKSLSDFWLAELMRRLLTHKLIVSELLNGHWRQIEPRLQNEGRQIKLTSEERDWAENLLVRALQQWGKVAPSFVFTANSRWF